MKTHKTILTNDITEFDSKIEEYLQDNFEVSRMHVYSDNDNIPVLFAYLEKNVKQNHIGYN